MRQIAGCAKHNQSAGPGRRLGTEEIHLISCCYYVLHLYGPHSCGPTFDRVAGDQAWETPKAANR